MENFRRKLMGPGYPGVQQVIFVDESQTQRPEPGPSNAKKRVRKETTIEERPAKRPKTDVIPRKVKISLAPSKKTTNTPKKPGKPKANATPKGSLGMPALKWKTLKSVQSADFKEGKPHGIVTLLRPRLWASNREELLAALPDMASSKCINGLAWEFYETPILLLDETNSNVFRISREGLDDYTLDLVTTRSFVCPVPLETIAQDDSMMLDPLQPIVKPDPLPNDPSVPQPQQPVAPKTKRKVRSYPTPKQKNVGDASQESTPAPLRINFKAPLPMYTSHNIGGDFAMPPLPPPNFHGRESDISSAAVSCPKIEQEDDQTSSAGVSSATIRLKLKGRPKKIPIDDNYIAPTAAAAQIASQAVQDLLFSAVSSLPLDSDQITPTVVPVSEAQNTVPTSEPRHGTTLHTALQNGDGSSMLAVLPSSSKERTISGPATTADTISPRNVHPKLDYTALTNAVMGASSTSSSSSNSKFTDSESIAQLLTEAEMKLSAITSNIPSILPQPDFVPLASSVDVSSLVNPSDIGHAETVGPQSSFIPGNLVPKLEEGCLPSDHIISHSDPQRITRYSLRSKKATGNANSSLLGGPPAVIVKANDLQANPTNSTPTGLLSDPASHVIPASAPRALPILDEKSKVHDISFHNSKNNNDSSHFQTNATNTDPLPNALTSSANEQPLDMEKPQGPPEHLAEYVPSPIPPELRAIIDAYLFGKPLTLILSSALVYDHWSLLLPPSIGNAMMGYFKILGVEENRVRLDEAVGSKESALSMAGQVEWRFRLQWAPGGEEFIMPNVDSKDLEHPWWKPPTNTRPSPDGSLTVDVVAIRAATPVLSKEPEDDFPTTPHYRKARLCHPEYKFRHHHFRELYESLLPTYILAPFGQQVRDLSFPRGWFCLGCGKINFQAALRHRRCTSVSCLKRPATVNPYAQSLFMMRDPQARLPISLPYNTFPKFVEPHFASFNDGTKTITYHLQKGSQNSFIKQVFTANHPPLQTEATSLLEDIQLNVELVRPYRDNSPFFVYSASCPKDNHCPTDMEWANVPLPINTAKKFMVDRVRLYADVHEPQLSVNCLKIRAWVASGHRKSPDIFRAKKNALSFLSLGCDVALTLIPRSMEWPSTKGGQVWYNPLNEGPEIEEEDPPSAPSNVKQEVSGTTGKARAFKKGERPTFVLTLVHGDMVILYGDDFEYSIKRDGTSFLLIASHESES